MVNNVIHISAVVLMQSFNSISYQGVWSTPKANEKKLNATFKVRLSTQSFLLKLLITL